MSERRDVDVGSCAYEAAPAPRAPTREDLERALDAGAVGALAAEAAPAFDVAGVPARFIDVPHVLATTPRDRLRAALDALPRDLDVVLEVPLPGAVALRIAGHVLDGAREGDRRRFALDARAAAALLVYAPEVLVEGRASAVPDAAVERLRRTLPAELRVQVTYDLD